MKDRIIQESIEANTRGEMNLSCLEYLNKIKLFIPELKGYLWDYWIDLFPP